jgi:hypothetical protein
MARSFSNKTFEEWVNNPLTATYLQFLEDQRAQLMADWGRGVPMAPEAQYKARHLLELSTLTYSDIEAFYAPEDDQTESGPT